VKTFYACTVFTLGHDGGRLMDGSEGSPGTKTWSVYLQDTPPKWLAVIEATTAEGAINIAAEKFGEEPERLIAVAAGCDV
jgi:hypothetical protein